MRKKHWILGILIIVFLIFGVCIIIIMIQDGFVVTKISPEERKFRHHLRFASILEKKISNSSWVSQISQQKIQQAVKLLSNGKLDEPVVFLSSAVAHHPIYGNMAQVIFIDECASVSEIAYQAPSKDSDNPAKRFLFLPSKQIYRQQRRIGCVWSEVILESSDKVTEGVVSDANLSEPDHLFLPKETYDTLIAGSGEMLLVNKDGNVLDRLPIKVGEIR